MEAPQAGWRLHRLPLRAEISLSAADGEEELVLLGVMGKEVAPAGRKGAASVHAPVLPPQKGILACSATFCRAEIRILLRREGENRSTCIMNGRWVILRERSAPQLVKIVFGRSSDGACRLVCFQFLFFLKAKAL